jgi:hypothetical protein
MYTVWDCIIHIEYSFYSCFCMSLVLILCVFHVRRVYRGLISFSLVLILHIPTYLGIKGAHFFYREDFFWRLFYVQIGVLQFVSRVQFYAKLNVINSYVTNLY